MADQTQHPPEVPVLEGHPPPVHTPWYHRYYHEFRSALRTARGISIGAALILDLGLVWLLIFRQTFNPEVGTAEFFWVRTFTGFIAYATLQYWTLAYGTARDSDIVASTDKFIALSPAIVTALCEIYWVGSPLSLLALSWRHHYVAAAYAIFGIVDYFGTDIVNQRLRARQIGIGPQSVG